MPAFISISTLFLVPSFKTSSLPAFYGLFFSSFLDFYIHIANQIRHLKHTRNVYYKPKGASVAAQTERENESAALPLPPRRLGCVRRHSMGAVTLALEITF